VLYIVHCFPRISLFSIFSGLAKKSSVMDASTLFQGEEFKGSNLYTSPPEEPTQLSTNNTALMDMIYGILDRDGPISPNFPTPIEQDLSKAKVMQWANSLAQYQSPVDKSPSPIYAEYDDSPPQNIPSPMGSMFSESASYDSSSGPKTPTLSGPVPAIVRRRFSYEEETKIPETPTRPPPEPPVHSTPPRYSSHTRTSPSPSPNPVPPMKATITSLVDDFMPEFIPSPVDTRPAKPTNLRISTQILPYPVTPTSQYPRLRLAPPLLPSLQVGQLVSPESNKSPTTVRSLSLVTERSKKLLKELEGHYSPVRPSMEFPPNKSIVSLERPLAPARHSMQSSPSKAIRFEERPRAQARPPVLSIVIEERSQVSGVNTSVPSAAGKTFDSRDRYRRRSSVTPSPTTKNMISEEYLRIQLRHSVMPPPSKPFQVEQLKSAPIRHSLPPPARRTQEEIEAIPVPAPVKPEEPASFGRNLGIWFTKGFFAGEQGMQFTMSRRVVTMSKTEWTIEGADGSRILKCQQQTNSLSRKKDFFDLEGNQLFDFQRRTGSTRTAESPQGTTLFVVKNASLHSKFPHINPTSALTYFNSESTLDSESDECFRRYCCPVGSKGRRSDRECGCDLGRIPSRSHILRI